MLGALIALLLVPSAAQARPGDLDQSFGSGGLVQVDPNPEDYSVAGGLAADDDGRVYYQDFGAITSISSTAVMRLNEKGEPDRSFGRNGRVNLTGPIHGALMEGAWDGRVILSGYSSPDFVSGVRIVRLDRNGELDRTFAGDGVFGLDQTGRVVDIEADSQGRLVVLLNLDDGAHLIRLDEAGEMDRGFGDAGVTPSADAQSLELALAPDGSAVLQTEFPSRLIRFTPQGQLDRSFGTDGVARVDPATGTGFFSGSLAVDSQNRPVYAKGVQLAWTDRPLKIGVFRMTASGEPDPTFDALPSLLDVPPGGEPLLTDDLEVDSQDRVLLSGSYGSPFLRSGIQTDPMTARLLPDGSLDPSFGEQGVSAFPRAYSQFPTPNFGFIDTGRPSEFLTYGSGVITRFELDSGTANADADYRPDRSDGCPRRYSIRKGGCEKLPVTLLIQEDGRTASGRIKAPEPCLGRGSSKPAVVRVYAAGRKDKKLGRARVDEMGRWTYKLPSRRMSVFAEFDGHRRLDIADCPQTRSRQIEF